MFAKISGININVISGCVPKNSYTLAEHTNGLLSEDDVKRFNKKTGFKNLRITDDNTTALDLCLKAAENIFKKENISKDSIDAVIFVTSSPDYPLPNNSSILQDRLGLPNFVLAFDINQGCPGFVQGLYTASALVNGGGINRVLLCVGDTRSKQTNVNDRKTRPLFGDAGTATIIERGNKNLLFTAESYGEFFDKAVIWYGGARHPKTYDSNDKEEWSKNFLSMDGWEMTNFVLSHAAPALQRLLKHYSLNVSDLGTVIVHQANKVFSKTIAEQLQLPYEQVPFLAENIGNTSGTSIVLALSSFGDNKNKYNLHNICLCSFGSGLGLAIAITDLNDTKFLGIDEL